jgi:hypothetical protein
MIAIFQLMMQFYLKLNTEKLWAMKYDPLHYKNNSNVSVPCD